MNLQYLSSPEGVFECERGFYMLRTKSLGMTVPGEKKSVKKCQNVKIEMKSFKTFQKRKIEKKSIKILQKTKMEKKFIKKVQNIN